MIFELMYSLPQETHYTEGKAGLSMSDLEEIAGISTRIRAAWAHVESNPTYSGEIELYCKMPRSTEYVVEFVVQLEGETYGIWKAFTQDLLDRFVEMSAEEVLHFEDNMPDMPLLHAALFEFLDVCGLPLLATPCSP